MLKAYPRLIHGQPYHSLINDIVHECSLLLRYATILDSIGLTPTSSHTYDAMFRERFEKLQAYMVKLNTMEEKNGQAADPQQGEAGLHRIE